MPRNTSTVSAEKPLAGAVICFTSVLPEDRTELAQYAQDMGAEHTLDLTSDVTHLIVGSTDSKKYQYVAKEREDVRVLRPDWIRVLRDVWMADQSIDMQALEAEYRLPTLFGLKICITGFEDLAFRNGFAEDIQKNGGSYTGDLTKDVTHLIAYTASGKKYDYAMMWQVKVVSVKWYQDSIKRGMQLDENLYHPRLSAEQQGDGAWNKKSPGSPKLGKRIREDLPKPETNRKIRRTASARFGSQHQEIWSDIVGNNGIDSHSDQATEGAIKPTNPILQTFRSDTDNTVSAKVKPLPESVNPSAGVLHGKHFATKGFNEKRKGLLVTTLTGLGGHVHDSLSQMVHQADVPSKDLFLIVPYCTDGSQRKIVEQKSVNTTLVTELWVEWCITMKKFIDPDTYVLGRPISRIALPAVSKLKVNTTGFHQVQTMHVSKVVSQLGAHYQEVFTPETSVLICNSSNVNPQKIVHATAWNIPIVTEKWLEQLVKQERIPSFEPFRIVRTSGAEVDRGTSAQIRDVEDATKTRTLPAVVDGASNGRAFDLVQDDQASQHSHPVQNPNFRHLQEISPNIQPKKAPQTKRKLFNSFDGILDTQNKANELLDKDTDTAIMADEDVENGDTNPDSMETRQRNHPNLEKQNDLIKEFFEIKAAAAAKKSEADRRPSAGKLREKKLLGRALSNLSNSSRASNDNGKDDDAQRLSLSRASSIHSVITDGLGVPLSNISRLPSDPKAISNQASRLERGKSDPVPPESLKLSSFHAQLHAFTNSQPVRAASPPPRSQDEGQLTYADSAEAVKLRAQLAEKRRARAKLGQHIGDPAPELHTEESEEKRQQDWRETERKLNGEGVLRDDEAIIGGGRRTRGRDRALAGLEAGKNVDDDWGAGVLI